MNTHTQPLQFRDGPRDGINTRGLSVRAQTVNEEERSIEAAVSTDTPVDVYDWRSGEMISEVLTADGAVLPDQAPLLETHMRWSLDTVLGSARNLRREGNGITGRLLFAKDDERADSVWNKIRQGHITDVSVGYRVLESTDIQPGGKATIGGEEYTAGRRRLRIATRWQLKEVSVVPIGADAAAKMREESRPFTKGKAMDPKLRAYLETIGLRSAATDEEARAVYDALSADARARADEAAADDPPGDNGGDGGRSDAGDNAGGGGDDAGRTDDNAGDNGGGGDGSAGTADNDGDGDDAGRQAGIQAERQRVRTITSLAGDDVPPALVARALDEGWDEARATREFLGAVRDSRRFEGGQPGGVPTRAPAGHVRDHGRDCNARSLAAATLIGQGLDPTDHVMHNGQREPGRADALTEQDADLGDRYRGMSAPDLFRECLRADTGRWYRTIDEAFDAARAAPSGGTLSYVFTTNAYARLIEGWNAVGDTTQGWCDEEDVANFLQQEDITLSASANLEQLPRGGTAKDASVSDNRETYKLARYAKKFTVDQQDIIDDRLGAIFGMPVEMGEAAARLRPDLVYALILQNPTLTDTGQVFNSTAVTSAGGHANLGTGALGSDNLKTGITAMGSQRDGDDVLNITPQYLLVPAALDWTAQGLCTVNSLAKLFADSSDPVYTTENLIARKRLVPVMDDRLGATGVRDPRTKSMRTGSDTGWYLASGGRRSIRVAYRRGTNRQPVMRAYTLDQGQWGQGWDINLDIGAAFMDFRSWYKSSGDA